MYPPFPRRLLILEDLIKIFAIIFHFHNTDPSFLSLILWKSFGVKSHEWNVLLRTVILGYVTFVLEYS